MREPTYFRQFPVPRPALFSYQPIGAGELVETRSNSIRLRSGSTTIEITALASDLFRVGMFGQGRPITYRSEAIAKQDWPDYAVKIAKDPGQIRLMTEAATAQIRLDPLRIGFADPTGHRFAEDDPDHGMGFLSVLPPESDPPDPIGPPSRVYKQHPSSERYFGCGERTGGLDKTGSKQIFWNVDPPGFHTAALNNLYTSIPFLVALDRGAAWGLFFDNPGRVEFNLAADHPDRSWFGADCGDLIYYVFVGPAIRKVIDRYTELTGRTPLPPLWALGFQQSRWGYRTADELRAIAREFRARDIPCDGLYLDIDYMDGFRVFTWDPVRFPDPPGLIAELKEAGFKVVTIVDPGVKVDDRYPVYLAGKEQDFYCKTFYGEEYHNVVWPGTSAFPDFTNPRVREWWGELHRALLDAGAAGIWCDMNEPTVFIPTLMTMPPDVVHPGGGEPRLHAQVHNLYGSLMARATREGLERLQPNRRPFVISRAGYAGLQRHALQWTGDNTSWWEHIWMGMPQLQNMGLSGLAWVGTDIGGFALDATGELLTRWTEFGIFQPFCRNHSARNTRHQEPWAFGEPYESMIRTLLELRQRLIPYLYSLFDDCHRTGAPILRPILFEYPDDPTGDVLDDEFLLGPALLVAPISQRGVTYRHVYLPRGTWLHFWTDQQYEGPAHILAEAPLGEPAVYVRANTAIPLWPKMQYVGEQAADPLTILIFPAAGEGTFTLYEDAGDGYDHERGGFARTPIDCRTDADRITIRIGEREGSFVPARTRIELELRTIGRRTEALNVLVDGDPAASWRQAGETAFITLPATAESHVIEVSRKEPL